jgi:parallel beta-helix repeat protein
MQVQRIVNSLKSVLLLIALLLVFNISNIFADSYVIVGSRGIGTKINSLPYTIASSGYYYIASDLSCDATNNGITITSDNVTLDLMGFSLNGPGAGNDYDGIYIDTLYNIEIRNGTIRNFGQYGINMTIGGGLGRGHRIINVRVMDNQNTGMQIWADGSLVERCTAIGNGTSGIYVYQGTIVRNNICYNNQLNGIYVGNKGCAVIGNVCYDNNYCGICFGADNNSLVDQNTAYNNTSYNFGGCATCTLGTNHAPPITP